MGDQQLRIKTSSEYFLTSRSRNKVFKEYKTNLPFEVNESGVVRNKYTGYIYKQSLRKGYYRVSTTLASKDRVQENVHKMVAQCFIDNPEGKPQVNHKDGDKLNNHVSNLEWVTSQGNRLHAFSIGTQKPSYGEACSSAVITESQAHEICKLIVENYRDVDISTMTGVKRKIIYDIRRGSSWKMVIKQYGIKPNPNRRISVKTVQWVCSRLEEGRSTEDIVRLSTNKRLDAVVVNKIKDREIYREVSDTYKF